MNTGPSSHWDITTLTFAGKTTQKDTSSPGDFWTMLSTVFLKQLWGETTRGVLICLLVNKHEVVWDVKVKTSFGNNGSEKMEFIVLSLKDLSPIQVAE